LIDQFFASAGFFFFSPNYACDLPPPQLRPFLSTRKFFPLQKRLFPLRLRNYFSDCVIASFRRLPESGVCFFFSRIPQSPGRNRLQGWFNHFSPSFSLVGGGPPPRRPPLTKSETFPTMILTYPPLTSITIGIRLLRRIFVLLQRPNRATLLND